MEYIKVIGARENNLKSISIDIPKNKLVVVTGLSGSGKSSLAFDTIYKEGKRRYIESLSTYARQFLGNMDKPKVDKIIGLSPAVSIDQKTTSNNPRSTVGTVTEIYDYLRLLFAKIGKVHCPICMCEIQKLSVDQIVDKILKLERNTRVEVLAPIKVEDNFKEKIQEILKYGFSRIYILDKMYDLMISEDEVLNMNINNSEIDIVIDRLVIRDGILSRLNQSVESALKYGSNFVKFRISDEKMENVEIKTFGSSFSCFYHGTNICEISPSIFSFNSHIGACSECYGIGHLIKIDEDLIMPDKNKTLYDGLKAFGPSTMKKAETVAKMYFEAIAKHYKKKINKKIKDLDKDLLNIILYGSNGEKIEFNINGRKSLKEFEGVIPILERRHSETKSDSQRKFYELYMREIPCRKCMGKRLKDSILSILINGKNIYDITSMQIDKIQEFFLNLNISEYERNIAKDILKEINTRIQFLIDVGLNYISLSREANTLSGGEYQRIRLATQIGSGLSGVIYVLDEPSIGLHQRDNDKLIKTLKNMRDLKNTLIVVEHDEDTIKAADFIIDIGPNAGENGGHLVASGSIQDIINEEKSITGKYLSCKKQIEVPKKRRISKNFLKIKKASENNLKNIDVNIPLNVFTCISGVSGSGKSSLINNILYTNIYSKLNKVNLKLGKCEKIENIDKIDKIICVDQSPIGRTPRSNPATYTGVFDLIREIFANTIKAREKGYGMGRFSFNVEGGRCENCKGDGVIKIEMHFLPDVYVQCDVCKGKRYNRETLDVRYKDKTISDILNMTVDDALIFFENVSKIQKILKTIQKVGLGYIRLGQSSITLSGGEAQRIKLAFELAKRQTGNTLYILDEPSTGLHIDDVNKLISVLQELVDQHNSVVVIEHNMDILKSADYIIDLGPEGGSLGGEIIAKGTPEEIVKNNKSYTGKYLKKYLAKR